MLLDRFLKRLLVLKRLAFVNRPFDWSSPTSSTSSITSPFPRRARIAASSPPLPAATPAATAGLVDCTACVDFIPGGKGEPEEVRGGGEDGDEEGGVAEDAVVDFIPGGMDIVVLLRLRFRTSVAWTSWSAAGGPAPCGLDVGGFFRPAGGVPLPLVIPGGGGGGAFLRPLDGADIVVLLRLRLRTSVA
jgi:hypothetical protein